MNVYEGPIRVLGSGVAYPGPSIDNFQLRKYIESFGEPRLGRTLRAVAERLAIKQRHFCRDLMSARAHPRPGDSNPELAARAVGKALEEAHLSAGKLGYLFGHTATPHTQLPPNAAWVADHLGYNGAYGELRQACTGFANALLLGAPMLSSPRAKPIAIVGSETGSVYFDPSRVDSDQLVNLAQMGDGAGAVILGPDDRQGARIRALFYGTLGHGHEPGLSMAGSCDSLEPHQFRQDFARIKEHGLLLFEAGLRGALELGVDVSRTWILPHQVNGRMDAVLADRFGLDPRRVLVTADRFGNLGSAAIWCALHECRARLRPGDEVLVLGAESTKYMYGGFVYVHG